MAASDLLETGQKAVWLGALGASIRVDEDWFARSWRPRSIEPRAGNLRS